MQADSSIFYIGNMSMKGGGGVRGRKGGVGKGGRERGEWCPKRV